MVVSEGALGVGLAVTREYASESRIPGGPSAPLGTEGVTALQVLEVPDEDRAAADDSTTTLAVGNLTIEMAPAHAVGHEN